MKFEARVSVLYKKVVDKVADEVEAYEKKQENQLKHRQEVLTKMSEKPPKDRFNEAVDARVAEVLKKKGKGKGSGQKPDYTSIYIENPENAEARDPYLPKNEVSPTKGGGKQKSKSQTKASANKGKSKGKSETKTGGKGSGKGKKGKGKGKKNPGKSGKK